MADQMKKLRKLGLSVGCLNSSISNQVDGSIQQGLYSSDRVPPSFSSLSLSDENPSHSEDIQFSMSVASGNCPIVFLHPEAIASPSESARKLLTGDKYQNNVVACVVDEAHCIVEWGSQKSSFRPDYGKLSTLRAYFPNVPIIALTATAPPTHVKLIIESLHLENPQFVTRSPNRPNIFYRRRLRLPTNCGPQSYDEILIPLANSLKSLKISHPLTVVYLPLKWCGYAFRLFEHILGAEQYLHDKELPEDRLFAQFHSPQDFMMKSLILGEIVKAVPVCRVIFATSALGMGVDAPNIEKVIHIGPPRSLEAYFQETGRAGRSGCKAEAILYFNKTDIKASIKDMDESVRKFCLSEGLCLRQQLLQHFNFMHHEEDPQNCCDVCLEKCQCSVCSDSRLVVCVGNEKAIEADVKIRCLLCNESRAKLTRSLKNLRLEYGIACSRLGGGIDSTTGLTLALIKSVVSKCEYIKDVNYLMENFDFWFKEHAESFFEVIKQHTLSLEH
eukprot:gene16284-17921_t